MLTLKVPRSKINPETGKKVRPCLGKGKANRKLIHTVVEGKYEYTYHATKGWRTRLV